jgi:glycosyltransferase involved in cell wall biosynthesis
MKIFIACEAVFPENKGGLERWISSLALHLHSLGNDVTYLNSAGVNANRKGVEYHSLSSHSWSYIKDGKRSIIQSIRFAVELRTFLIKQESDLLYVVQTPIFSVLALLFRPKKIRLIFVEWFEIWSLKYWQSYLGMFQGLIGFLLQLIAIQVGDKKIVFSKRCDAQVSRFSIRKNINKMPGLCPDPSTQEFKKYRFRTDIIYLSRLVAEKQPLMAISLAQELNRRGWEGHMHLVGTGPLAEDIKKDILKTQSCEFVFFHENASDEQVQKLFENCFLMFHPSKREGFGLSMVEAAVAGVPTLLIAYPDNISVDLQISPSLICDSDNPEIVVEKALFAFQNQQEVFEEMQVWLTEKMPQMTTSDSARKIYELAAQSLAQ